jgi:phosphatidylglycerophosphate synthase
VLAAKVGANIDRWFSGFFSFLDRIGIRPNFLTLSGLIVTIFAMLSLIFGYFRTGGLLILCAGAFDILDGGVARVSGKNNDFGGFLDSIIDRYADLLLLTGLVIYYARIERLDCVVITCIVMIGTVLIPYTRAKAERYLIRCNVGLMERPERIIVLSAGGILNGMPVALLILGVLTHLTVFQRIHYSWKEMVKDKKVMSNISKEV